MTDDDIIDTIAAHLWRNPRESQRLIASTLLTALRSAGYRITEDRCEKDYHSTPHKGCILR